MSPSSDGSPFRPGAVVILYLHDPREKIWGILTSLDGAGVAVRGIDLQSFDDWLRELGGGEGPGIRPSMGFYPLLRVEKILMDEGGEGVPSLEGLCRARTGRDARGLLEAVAS